MTEVAHRRDFAELAALLVSQKETYAELLSLSRAQEEVFRRKGTRGLMKIIARKQTLIKRLDVVDGSLQPYTSDWQQTLDALPEQARRCVAAFITDIGVIVRDLVESEKAIERVVTEARDQKGAQARALRGARSAVSAYSGAAACASGRYLDREG